VMFKVDEAGNTRHISTLNCAFRRRVFDTVGGFDESMAAGGEDSELSHRMQQAGLRVRYQRSAVVEHEARTSLVQFTTWFFRRGRAAYQLSRRAPAGPVIRARLSSYRRIVGMNARDARVLLIVPLLGASVILQQAGWAWEFATRHDGRR
jgi:GT2 family glycosyltransferase